MLSIYITIRDKQRDVVAHREKKNWPTARMYTEKERER